MVSVIVPIYNVEDYLRQCLDSVVTQTYKDLEIILVDDGSTDNSGRICDEYTDKDARINVIHQKNCGLSGARNSGLRVATGDYIIMPDGDDVLHPRMIETLYSAIISEDYGFSMCYGDKVSSAPEHFELNIKNTNLIEQNADICMKNLFLGDINNRIQYNVVWNKLYKRSYLSKLEFASTSSEDLYFQSLLFQKMEKAVIIPIYLYYWIQRQSSITHQRFNLWWAKRLVSFKLCLDAIPTANALFRSYCLIALFRTALSVRLWSKDTPFYGIIMKDIRNIRKQTQREYYTNIYIPLSEKLINFLFYNIPFLYQLYISFIELKVRYKKTLFSSKHST